MSAGRTLALVVLALLLITTVGAANVVMTGERTVLSAEFVDQTLTEEEGYSQVESIAVESVTDQVEQTAPTQSGQLPAALQGEIDAAQIVDGAVTTSYIRDQSQSNLVRFYDFLHGARDDSGLRIDLAPLKSNLADAVGEQVGDVDVGALVDEYAPTTADSPIEISGARVERMRADQSGYQDVRGAFRDEIRNATYERLRQSDPGLLLGTIGEDPRQYSSDSERRRAVDSNEQEIRGELRRLTQPNADNEINERFTQELADRAQQAKQRVRQRTREATQQFPTNVTQAATDLQIAVIDGLATDTDYDTFSSRVDAAEQTLSDEASRLAAAQIDDEVPDTVSLTEEFTQEDREQLQTLANWVQRVDTANTVLPVVALVLIGLVFVVGRSLGTTALTTGLAVSIVGVGGFIGAKMAGNPVETAIGDQLSGQGQAEIQPVAIGFVEQVLGVLGSQSLLLIVVGVVLLLVWLAARLGVLGSPTESGAAAAPETTGGGDDADPLDDKR